MRYFKEQIKTVLSKTSYLFCNPLSRNETRKLPFLKEVFKTEAFELNQLTINNKIIQLEVTVSYPDSMLFKIEKTADLNLSILPTGGVCVEKDIISTGFTGQYFYSIFGKIKSFYKIKKNINGTIVANWPNRFLTYGDFVLQLLPELCAIKSMLSNEEWSNTHFIIPQTPEFLIEYLALLGCRSSQIINSSNYYFNVLAESIIYFREKDPMWFLCAPPKLVSIARNNFIYNEITSSQIGTIEEILFIERLDSYRKAIGMTEAIKNRLQDIGVKFIDPTSISIKEQIDTFAFAKMVVGIHGAGLANIMWCQSNTKVIEIFHPNFSPWCYAILANQIGLEYHCVGGTPGHMDINFRESDVDVDWDCLYDKIQKLKN